VLLGSFCGNLNCFEKKKMTDFFSSLAQCIEETKYELNERIAMNHKPFTVEDIFGPSKDRARIELRTNRNLVYYCQELFLHLKGEASNEWRWRDTISDEEERTNVTSLLTWLLNRLYKLPNLSEEPPVPLEPYAQRNCKKKDTILIMIKILASIVLAENSATAASHDPPANNNQVHDIMLKLQDDVRNLEIGHNSLWRNHDILQSRVTKMETAMNMNISDRGGADGDNANHNKRSKADQVGENPDGFSVTSSVLADLETMSLSLGSSTSQSSSKHGKSILQERFPKSPPPIYLPVPAEGGMFASSVLVTVTEELTGESDVFPSKSAAKADAFGKLRVKLENFFNVSHSSSISEVNAVKELLAKVKHNGGDPTFDYDGRLQVQSERDRHEDIECTGPSPKEHQIC
jgi:hypothetical protein